MTNENPPQTKVDASEQKPEEVSSEEEGLISAEDIDKIIQENDPEFSQSLMQVTSVPAQQVQNIDSLDIDKILKEESGHGFWLWSLRRNFVPTLAMFIKNIKPLTIKAIKEGPPFLLKKAKEMVSNLAHSVSSALTWFKYLSLKRKLATVGLSLLSIFVVIFIYRSLTVGIIPKPPPLFVNSMEEWAEKTYSYHPSDAQESFYDSSRVKQNIISLRRTVVNLKPSASSGSNPMAFFEFFVEGNSTDVVIEIKDREYEVIDQIQRIMEDFTFNELDSSEGKQALLEKIRKEINSFLTKGKIRKVYIKQAIVKP